MALIFPGLPYVSLPALNFFRIMLVTFCCHDKITRENPKLQSMVPSLHCSWVTVGWSIMVELNCLLLGSCEEGQGRKGTRYRAFSPGGSPLLAFPPLLTSPPSWTNHKPLGWRGPYRFQLTRSTFSGVHCDLILLVSILHRCVVLSLGSGFTSNTQLSICGQSVWKHSQLAVSQICCQ